MDTDGARDEMDGELDDVTNRPLTTTEAEAMFAATDEAEANRRAVPLPTTPAESVAHALGGVVTRYPVADEHGCTVTKWNEQSVKWSIVCRTCGTVGEAQVFEADAYNIADRHEELGGFER